MKKYVAFFDLDDTILNDSSGTLYVKYMFQKGKISWYNMLKTLFIGLVHEIGFINTEDIIKRWAMRYKGMPEKKIFEKSKIWFDDILVKNFRESIVSEIKFHKNNGGEVVILSGATPYICNAVKDNLEMDDIICTEPEVIDGRFTGKLLNYCYGKQKLQRALSYCSENNYSLDDAYYYGDSIADNYILEKVGNPVCVSPDWRLKQQAKKMDWKVIN